MRPTAIALARTVNAAFFLVTSAYCLLTFSPFAYEQFVRPNISAWLTNFVVLYAALYWLALCVTALTFAPFLRDSRGRWMAIVYLAAGAALGLWLPGHAGLPGPQRPALSLALAFAALVPLVWLAVFDHVSVPRPPMTQAAGGRRLLAACLATGTYVWAVYAAEAPIWLSQIGGQPLTGPGLALAVATSIILHVSAFTMLFLVMTAIGRVTKRAARAATADYWLGGGVAALAVGVVMSRLVLAPIAVTGASAAALAAASGAALILVWSGVARHLSADRRRRPLTALDAWLAPVMVARSPRVRLLTLALLPLVAFAVVRQVAPFDWGFMFQKLGVLAIWVVTFACVYNLFIDRPARGAGERADAGKWGVAGTSLAVLAVLAATMAMIPRLCSGARDARLQPDLVLDTYAAADSSFRVLREMLLSGRAGPGDAGFFSYLRAHSNIQVPVNPASVDFVSAFVPVARPPHVFVFIIDSLRPDYVSTYNPAVTFTPEMAKFAADSFVFERAFTRYGGTGLAVPAIWAGAMLIHKEYVTPFAPMNALEKLLNATGHRRFIAEDHLTNDLFPPSRATVRLDVNVPEMQHTFCGTLRELEGDLRSAGDDPSPVFALTRPLDLHIGNVSSARVPAGESYPGFFGPYAARVRRMDACFGGFIDFLKRARLYEDSIIVLMSDHGDSLGEGLRWGHGYTVFPEVLRIPLVIHLPAALARDVTADLGGVSFSTDVTPTLYALLGQKPARPRGAAGSPLFGMAGTAPDDAEGRRRESFLVASSYGAVYGLLRQNGRSLYIADAIDGREYAYELGADRSERRVGLTDTERAANRRMVQAQIADLAAWYGFAP